MHTLRDCAKVKDVWRTSGLLMGSRSWQVTEGWEWVAAVLELDGAVVDLIFTVAWLVWYERNLVVNEGHQWAATRIISRMENLLADFKAANVAVYMPSPLEPSRWAPPPQNVFKVNFDAAWLNNQTEFGIGVVVSNHSGDFYAGMSKVGTKAASAELAEFFAAKEALIFAIEAGSREAVVEGDCKAVINAIRALEEGVSSGGVIVVDIARIGRMCYILNFSFVRREGHGVAHFFAKFARTIFYFVF